MSSEHLNFHQAREGNKQLHQNSDSIETEVFESEGFDLSAFFNDSDSDAVVITPIPNLLVTLRDDSNEAIATITAQVTAETFAAGSSLAASVFSTLGSLIGSCGVFCAHTLGSLAQVGNPGLSSISGLGNINRPRLSADAAGNFHLDGNIDSLARMTGISPADLSSGKFTAEDILSKFISIFGKNIGLVFGFGLIESIINCMFDNFMPIGKA